MAAILRVKNPDGSWEELPVIKGTQGPPGPSGSDGRDGKTPVRGVDYWTEEDQQIIINDILSKIENLEEVSF